MSFHSSFKHARVALAASMVASLLAGCAIGPDYKRPDVAVPTDFKEAGTLWRVTRPAPRAAIDGRWWTAFGDETLAELCERALKANQTIAEYEAAYRAARAAVASSRASLFPTVSLSGAGTRSGTGAKAASSSSSSATSGASNGQYLSKSVSVSLDASWEPDLWGSVRRSIESADATAQASAAQLAAEQLSTTASLAVDYFTVRLADADLAILGEERTVDAELLALTEASYRQGVSSYDDVRTAHNTLRAIDESIASAQLTRRQYEHAIAVLVGEPPATFSLPVRKDFSFALPALPRTVPSELLERRPDVVQAERTMAEYNAKIGVAKAGYFPSLTLSASGGYDGASLAHLVSLPTRVWSLGLSVAQTVFDAGATSASVRQARASYDQQVAAYRQTVLSAFQDVEDYLSAVEIGAAQALAAQEVARRSGELAVSKRKAFDAGTASRIDVLDTQLTEIGDRKTWLDYSGQTLQSAVLLVKALGGGWNGDTAPVLARRE
ncbi:efflux transporter outer membrane subunit [Trinickia caryophylli]|uniref:Efflux transporter, outer membrane factor (OMF) lipoprotein, NodT family n=1 Tax=Trinickia caryophylli TaxID=28094 RepID=A0A1X7FVX1_TRICW|nr:efflux transporter outer membrane subunit [Trinickia caryophylli]PMS11811.1 RND transporter [Trinickia caryophylli]TRX17493.1 efflux transporter outer membrane subunit [Trinickia caryophylli]WQE11761.1 efflux transporter outer membrane subunit [Trinickia caryophylli]SMF59663.1 efflux transporter, outer membrane factor (OMF) lipoprotein, NodT family [Trinickia caryophylli]GLU34741.1 outer membrane efflux lipoprotein [Trinickia caryophylli]